MEETTWDFLDLSNTSSQRYIPYLSQEYDPLKPHDYTSVVDMIKKFKRDLARKSHTVETNSIKENDIEPLSCKAAVIRNENADDAYRRRGGMDIVEKDDEINSRVLLFYRIENTMQEREIKAQVLKMVEPFGKILEIMLDRVPDYVGLASQDNLRVYVKFKDSSSSKKGNFIYL